MSGGCGVDGLLDAELEELRVDRIEDAVAHLDFTTAHGLADDLEIDALHRVLPGEEIRGVAQRASERAALQAGEAELEISTLADDGGQVRTVGGVVRTAVEEVFQHVRSSIIVRISTQGAGVAIGGEPCGKGGRCGVDDRHGRGGRRTSRRPRERGGEAAIRLCARAIRDRHVDGFCRFTRGEGHGEAAQRGVVRASERGAVRSADGGRAAELKVAVAIHGERHTAAVVVVGEPPVVGVAVEDASRRLHRHLHRRFNHQLPEIITELKLWQTG